MANPHFVPFNNYSCKNCGNEFTGIVCNHCGQHPVLNKLSIKTLWREWRERRKYDSGKLYKTISGLILKPGAVISEYLGGKRHNWYNAVNFFLLVASITAFVSIQFSSFNQEESIKATEAMYQSLGIPTSPSQNEFMGKYMGWIQHHMNVMLLTALPFFALSSFIIFRKREYNLGEHLIMHCYGYGFINLIMLPFFIFSNPLDLGGIYMISSTSITILVYSWIYKDTFKLSWIRSILYSILWYILYFVLIFAIIIVATIIISIIAILIIFILKKVGLLG